MRAKADKWLVETIPEDALCRLDSLDVHHVLLLVVPKVRCIFTGIHLYGHLGVAKALQFLLEYKLLVIIVRD